MRFYLDPDVHILLQRPELKRTVPITIIEYYDLRRMETKKYVSNLLLVTTKHLGVNYTTSDLLQRQICIKRVRLSELETPIIEKIVKKFLKDSDDSIKGCEIIKNKRPPYWERIEDQVFTVTRLAEDVAYISTEIMEFI